MEKKVKVLFFIESLAGGGAEKVLSTLANHINKDLFDVTVVSVISEGVHADQIAHVAHFRPLIKTQNKFLYKVLYHLIYFYLPPRLVYNLFFPKKSDIEVAFCEGFATKFLSHSPCKRKIAWVHIDIQQNPWTQKIVYSSVEEERNTYLQYNKIICVSDTVKKAVENKFNIQAQTCYNPIDSNWIIEKAKEQVEIPKKSSLRMITTGRLVEQKGYDRLLNVVKQLKDENYEFELWILGEGPDKQKLMHYIELHNLHNYVKLWGFVNNPYPYLVACDVFVCSSRSEGYSTAATEAVILGLPVVTTLCSGMQELLGDNVFGIIVENEDLSLLQPLREILDNPLYLNNLKERAVKRSKDFNIISLMQTIENVFQ